jgi:hypothetical protein
MQEGVIQGKRWFLNLHEGESGPNKGKQKFAGDLV